MTTPDEIKRGLEHCISDVGCIGCVYYDECVGDGTYEPLMMDALAYIRQLEAKAPKWISVEEGLPEHDVRVQLGYSRMQYVDQGYLDSEDMDWYDVYDDRVARPTHWMPMPEPPKEDAHEHID